MLLDIDSASLRAWRELTSEISFELRREAESTSIRPRLLELLAEQVEGIVSIPRKAAERVESLALEAVLEGTRAKEIAHEISRSGEVSQSDAMRLARTSVSAASTALMQARSEAAGSVGYVWETARDSAVRPTHREMQGKFVKWDEPPVIDGYAAHAGQFANCRCWPRPIFNLE
jgi:SPP1 gp7 family putative phage head morphogenesis protein